MEEFGMLIQVGHPFAGFTYSNDVKRSHSEFIWVSQDNIPVAYTKNKTADDIEFAYLRQGLEILNGGSLNFGDK